jgi:hypothetical protein
MVGARTGSWLSRADHPRKGKKGSKRKVKRVLWYGGDLIVPRYLSALVFGTRQTIPKMAIATGNA